MIGVFVSFTLSQAGMVVHWRRLRGPGLADQRGRSTGIGAVVTGVVLVVVAITKAHEGAWIIMLLIPMHVLVFRATRRHYDEVARQLSLEGWQPHGTRHKNTVIVPISGMQRAVVQALDYAKTLSTDVRGRLRQHRSAGNGSTVRTVAVLRGAQDDVAVHVVLEMLLRLVAHAHRALPR